MKKDAVIMEETPTEKLDTQKKKTEKEASVTVAKNRLTEELPSKNRMKKTSEKQKTSLSQESWTENFEPEEVEPLPEIKDIPEEIKASATKQKPVAKPEAEKKSEILISPNDKSRTQEMQAFIGDLTTLEVRKKHVVRSAAIISNKGGVGKTHVANNMSFYMSRLGKKVLTIDLDLGNADIANKLGFYCKNTIIDLFNGTEEIDQLIYSTPYGFDLIAGESGNFKLANLTNAHKNRFIKALRHVSGEYDYVVYDLSAGISSTTIDFALAQDYQIIITTPQDIIAGYSCIKAAFFRFQEVEQAMAQRDPSYKPRKVFRPFVILNQVSDFGSGRALFEKIVSVSKDNIKCNKDFSLSINLLGVITSDSVKVREVELKHRLYSDAHGASKIGQCYHFLSHNLMQYKDPNSMGFKTNFKRFVNLFMKSVDEYKYAQ
ncbi:MAG: MinD/ParA family protein [Desulfobacula sp.]|nr:MinD/ParA family protein [Desulfobacula sp.]